MAQMDNWRQDAIQLTQDDITVQDALKLLEWACMCPDKLRKASLPDIFRENGGFEIIQSNLKHLTHASPKKDFTAN